MAVPVWAAKLGVATAKGLLGGDEDGKNFFRAIMLIVGGIIALLCIKKTTLSVKIIYSKKENSFILA